MGVIHSYIWRKGSIWITAAAHRHRVSALRRNPSRQWSSHQRALTRRRQIHHIKGRAKIHDDKDLKAWFYPELASALRSTPEEVKAFEDMLDSPLRIVIEVVPENGLPTMALRCARIHSGPLMSQSSQSPLRRTQCDLPRRKSEEDSAMTDYQHIIVDTPRPNVSRITLNRPDSGMR